jgi:hypothetical protein
MKRTPSFYAFFSLLFSLQFCLSTWAQNSELHPLSDALDYHGFLDAAASEQDPTKKKDILLAAKAILSKYHILDDSEECKLVDQFDEVNSNLGTSSFSANGNAHSGLVPLDASEMIDVLSKVIADRFREELTLAYLDRLRVKLSNDKLLRSVFPNAYRVLLNDDPFNYNAWLSSFRGALHLDLNAMPKQIPTIIQGIANSDLVTEKQKGKIDTLLKEWKMFESFIHSPNDSYKNITSLLDSLAQGKSQWLKDPQMQQMLGNVNILLKELSSSDYRTWVSNSDFSTLLSDPKRTKTFTGFLLAKHKTSLHSISHSSGGLVKQFFSKSGNEEKSFFNQLLQDVRQITEQINSIAGHQNSGEKDKLLSAYLRLTNLTMQLSGDVIDYCSSNEDLKKRWAQMDSMVLLVTDVQKDINNKDYSQILPDVLHAVNIFVHDSVMQKSLFLKDVLRYANLAVSLSTAQTSEEFASAIENSILPAQSYRLKRSSLFSISVNAYAGGFLASERLLDPAVKHRTSTLTGFTAPIGLGFNWGITRCTAGKFSKTPVVTKCRMVKTEAGKKNAEGKDSKCKTCLVTNGRYFTGHSISLYASVIDIGAVVAFRLQDTVSPSATVQWKNIIAPGAYVVWGIGKTPLAFQFGAQYGPELRAVAVTNGVTKTEINSRAWRFGAALTVDIPLYNLYSRSERVQGKLRREFDKK